jgi:hypothetical protein
MDADKLSLMDIAISESGYSRKNFIGINSTGCGNREYWSELVIEPLVDLGIFGETILQLKSEGEIFLLNQPTSYSFEIEPEENQDDIYSKFFNYFENEFRTFITIFLMSVVKETYYDKDYRIKESDKWYFDIHMD